MAGLLMLTLGIIGRCMLWMTGDGEVRPLRELHRVAIDDPFGAQFMGMAHLLKPGGWLASSGGVGLVTFGGLHAFFG
jgi:hypothetical protein